jgi:23S rRNA (cytidine1920-2'-O)/16S rRNA (cytidine1409-2'-O)-methyltransferase
VKDRLRLDQALVELGLSPSREQSKKMIMAGEVYFQGRGILKPSFLVERRDLFAIELRRLETIPVSRGKEKIAPVLKGLGWELKGATCLDVGASTGGFTEALLEQGARIVWAVDVGHNQLHERLRMDPRVVVREGVNFRFFSAEKEGVRFDYAVMDVSFISVRLLIPPLYEALKPRGEALILFKPQFEVGRESVGKGGSVRDPEAVERALKEVESALALTGFRLLHRIPSPLPGKRAKNQECFLHVEKPAPPDPLMVAEKPETGENK